MITQNKRLAGMVLLVVVLLFIPLIAMQFTDEVNWTISDFIVAAILLFGTAFLIEGLLRTVRKTKYRVAGCIALLLLLLLLWAEMAVGIFGSPIAGS
jgi:hypothetical protein